MTLVPRYDIKIGDYRFTRVNNMLVKRSIRRVVATCNIKMPISAILQDKDIQTTTEVSRIVKAGDKVTAKMYYEGFESHAEIFEGYVKRVNYALPLEIECEDKIYLLRQKRVQKTWKETTVKEVLSYLISDTGIVLSGNIPSIPLKPYIIKECDAAFALQKIKDDFGLVAFINPKGELYCGLSFTEDYGTVAYSITGDDTNVINADELKYRIASDTRMSVKAIGVNGDNTRVEAEIGDKSGQQRTVFFYNISDKKKLEELAAEELKKYRFDGYEGKLKTLGIPRVMPGMSASIIDPKFGRTGKYFVEETTSEGGRGGIRQEPVIGIKLQQ